MTTPTKSTRPSLVLRFSFGRCCCVCFCVPVSCNAILNKITRCCPTCCCGCNANRSDSSRWIILKPTCLIFLHDPIDSAPSEVVTFDRTLSVRWGALNTGSHNKLIVITSEGTIELTFKNRTTAVNWARSLHLAKGSSEWCSGHALGSFAPVRNAFSKDNTSSSSSSSHQIISSALPLVDGESYYPTLYTALMAAEREIFITDWWMHPYTYLKRPASTYPESRLDRVLEKRAKEGIKIYILLWKEVSLAVPHNSFWTTRYLHSLHPENILTMRHPNHFGSRGVRYWSHHEKIVCIDQHVAFLGGLDVTYGRYDTCNHDMFDRNHDATLIETNKVKEEGNGTKYESKETFKNKKNDKTKELGENEKQEKQKTKTIDDTGCHGGGNFPGRDYNNARVEGFAEVSRWDDQIDRTNTPRMPWHDVHCMIIGEPARDVARHFIHRWNFAKSNKGSPRKPLIPTVKAAWEYQNALKSPENVDDFEDSKQSPKRRMQSVLRSPKHTRFTPNSFSTKTTGNAKTNTTNTMNTMNTVNNNEMKTFDSNATDNEMDTIMEEVANEEATREDQLMMDLMYLDQVENNAETGKGKVENAEYQDVHEVDVDVYDIVGIGMNEEDHPEVEPLHSDNTTNIEKIMNSDSKMHNVMANNNNNNNNTHQNQDNHSNLRNNDPNRLKRTTKTRNMYIENVMYHGIKMVDASLAYDTRQCNTLVSKLPATVACECQVVRSLGEWSGGVHENSIYTAYRRLIRRAKRYIIIENQFFISGMEGNQRVKNRIIDEIYQRIVKAHAETPNQFKIYLFIPLVPSEASEIDISPVIRACMHWQFQTLSRGPSSLFSLLQKRGINPLDYIAIFSLRTHDITPETGVPVSEMVYIHSKTCIVDDKYAIIGSANINDRSLVGNRDSEIAVTLHDTCQFINLTMSNGKIIKGGKLCYELRSRLLQEHVGIVPEQLHLYDDLSDTKVFQKMIKIAQNNTKIYLNVFGCVPNDNVHSFVELKKYRRTLHREKIKLNQNNETKMGEEEEEKDDKEKRSSSNTTPSVNKNQTIEHQDKETKRNTSGKPNLSSSSSAVNISTTFSTRMAYNSSHSSSKILKHTVPDCYAEPKDGTDENVLKQLSNVQGHIVMYPLEFLKDEEGAQLLPHFGEKEFLVSSHFFT